MNQVQATEPAASDAVMMLCPNLKCRKVLAVPGACRGKHVRCKFCSLTFEVPLPKNAQPR